MHSSDVTVEGHGDGVHIEVGSVGVLYGIPVFLQVPYDWQLLSSVMASR